MVPDIVDARGYWRSVCDDISLANRYLSVLEEINCSYLQEIAKKYLNPNKISISLLLPKEKINEIS